MFLIKMNKINDILDTEYGIFKAIFNLNAFTWLSSDNAELLDIDYYLNHSGNKYISPLTYKLFDADASTYLEKLAKIIVLKYGDNWKKIYDVYFNTDYKPLENYSMVEDEKVNTDLSVTTDGDVNNYGFNTPDTDEDGIPVSKNSIKQTTSGSDEKNTRNLQRYGNIGVTTSQMMLGSELDLRQYDFYKMMMDNIDDVMCLAYREV